jgi:hypothetical protein
MSAFIVPRETMDRCVAAIIDLYETNPSRFVYVAPELHKLIGDADALGVALFALNKDAIMQRYNDPGFAETPAYFFTRRHLVSRIESPRRSTASPTSATRATCPTRRSTRSWTGSRASSPARSSGGSPNIRERIGFHGKRHDLQPDPCRVLRHVHPAR